MEAFHRAFPDLRIEIEDAFAVNDKIVLRYTAHGTQTGTYYDIPASGKTVEVRGFTIFEMVNRKIKSPGMRFSQSIELLDKPVIQVLGDNVWPFSPITPVQERIN